MKYYRLVLITQNQSKREKANKLAEAIANKLKSTRNIEVSKYEKFDNSFKIEVFGQITNHDHSVLESIDLTDQFCSPWEVTFHRRSNEIELIFNKTKNSTFRTEHYNVIHWASFQIAY